MRFPSDGGKRIYSCNEGNSKHWDQPIKDAVEVGKVSVMYERSISCVVAQLMANCFVLCGIECIIL